MDGCDHRRRQLPTVALNPIIAGDWSPDAEGAAVAADAHVTGDFSNYTLTLPPDQPRSHPGHHGLLVQGDLPERFRLRAAADRLPAGRRAGAADRLSVERLPEFPAGAAGVFLAALPELGRALGSRFRNDDVRTAVGGRRRTELSAGSGGGRGDLVNATQRRSLVSLARLVDYEPQPAISATTTLQCNVSAARHRGGRGACFDAGARRHAVPFEIGIGLADTSHYPVSNLGTTASNPIGSTTTSNAGRRARPICGCRATASPSPRAKRC